MSRFSLVALALAGLSLVAAVPAHAFLITVNFTVAGDPNDPDNAGTSASGSFSFDSSIIPPGGGGIDNPATSGFNLTWDGTSWDDTNASFGSIVADEALVFDSGGQLVDWNAFGDPNLIAMDGGDDFILEGVGVPGFFYVKSGSSTLYTGTVSWTTSTTTGEAPEPGSLLLFGPALLALGAFRGRRS